MRKYVARRVLFTIPTALIVAIIVFAVMRLIPGDAALLMSAGDAEQRSNIQRYEELKQRLGLDRPFYEQFGDWFWGIIRHGDLGTSYWTKEPVAQEILRRLPVTIELAIGSVIIGVALAIPLGVVAATRQDKLEDHIPRVVSVLLLSTPNFWVATLLVLLPALWFNYLPSLTYVSFWDEPWRHIQIFLFPWLAVGTRLVGTTLRMTRSSLLEVLRQDYIRTAWSKGLRPRAIVYRHALKNALIPVVTVIGTQVAGLLEGSVLIETVFNLDGLGYLTVQAIFQRDYPQAQACVLAIALIVLVVNLLTDLCYAWLDPRIRYS
jgi:peptide/nickel transport system permease protein